MTPTLHEEVHFNVFCEASIMLMPKLYTDIKRKESLLCTQCKKNIIKALVNQIQKYVIHHN